MASQNCLKQSASESFAEEQVKAAQAATDRRVAAELAVLQCSSSVRLAEMALVQADQASIATAEAAEERLQTTLRMLNKEDDDSADEAERNRFMQNVDMLEAQESSARHALLSEEMSRAAFSAEKKNRAALVAVDAAHSKKRSVSTASAQAVECLSTCQREEEVALNNAMAAAARYKEAKAVASRAAETETRTRDQAQGLLGVTEDGALHQAAKDTRHARAVADAGVARLEHELSQARDLVSAVQTLQEEAANHAQNAAAAERTAREEAYDTTRVWRVAGRSSRAASTPRRSVSAGVTRQIEDGRDTAGRNNDIWSGLGINDNKLGNDISGAHEEYHKDKRSTGKRVDNNPQFEYQDLAQGGSLQAQAERTPQPTLHHRTFESRGFRDHDSRRRKSPKARRSKASGLKQFAQLSPQRQRRLLQLSSPTRVRARTPAKQLSTPRKTAKRKSARQSRTPQEAETAARLHGWQARKEEELAWQQRQKQVNEQEEFIEEQARAAKLVVGARLSETERHERHQRALANSVGRIWNLARGVYEQAVYSASEGLSPLADITDSDRKWKVRAEFSRALRNHELSLSDAQECKLRDLIESGVDDRTAIADLLRGESVSLTLIYLVLNAIFLANCRLVGLVRT